MQFLELKIPPPVVATLIGFAMWGISLVTPLIELPAPIRIAVAIAIAVVGGTFDLAGIIAFRRVRTTIHPMRPHNTSAFVNYGIYKVTRNPMYLGLVFILVAWAVFLSSAWSLLGPLAFVLYIGRFQITPEERFLLAKFGTAYSDYKAKVPRWL
ncbi:MAG: isoprenylcysteine carboxylmethyltransferase family protein [Betaproteobacteria bacterium]|nr:isoprenylcysteine carboxylmethyltransferase family protein [Betaproteobacteria bacterium]